MAPGLLDRRWGDCKLCSWVRNPYYAPAGYLARLCVNIGTLIWALVVLSREGALDGRRWYVYRNMLRYMPEDFWAWGAVILVTVGLYRLLARVTPTWWGALGYGAMMLFWVYLAASLFTDEGRANGAPSPAATGSILVMAFLSVIATASNAKVSHCEPV